MFEVLSIAVVVFLVVLGVSYLAVIGCFIYYHNQLFNHLLYQETPREGIVFGDHTIEELPDSIEIDDLIKD